MEQGEHLFAISKSSDTPHVFRFLLLPDCAIVLAKRECLVHYKTASSITRLLLLCSEASYSLAALTAYSNVSSCFSQENLYFICGKESGEGAGFGSFFFIMSIVTVKFY